MRSTEEAGLVDSWFNELKKLSMEAVRPEVELPKAFTTLLVRFNKLVCDDNWLVLVRTFALAKAS